MTLSSLQDLYAPASVCFGCGPANPDGLHIRSRAEGDILVCDWKPQPGHHAFDGILSGGIVGTVLDCHSNWTAAYALMRRDGLPSPPPTVTSEFTVRLLRPTPMETVLHLEAKAVDLAGDRALVESTLTAVGRVTATLRGTFVAVKEGHPAFERWGGPAKPGALGRNV